MPLNPSTQRLIVQAVKVLAVITFIYSFWIYIVGFLALCGAYYLFMEYQKNNRRF